MNALLWLDETSRAKFNLFEYFKLALLNLHEADLRIVSNLNYINEINNLIILDEHFESHMKLLLQDEVINELNKNNCKVIIFNFEKIYNSKFKYNLKNQKKLKKINNLIQILSDVDDIKKIGSPFVNKQLISKEFKPNFHLQEKKNEILFIGQIKGEAYKNRRVILEQISQTSNIPLTFKFTNRKYSFDNFLSELSKYQYILNPLGAGSFINVRFYESLLVNSIPIQQFKPNMKSYFSELNEGYSINFEKIDESLNQIIKNFKIKKFNYFLEDYLHESNYLSLIRK